MTSRVARSTDWIPVFVSLIDAIYLSADTLYIPSQRYLRLFDVFLYGLVIGQPRQHVCWHRRSASARWHIYRRFYKAKLRIEPNGLPLSTARRAVKSGRQSLGLLARDSVIVIDALDECTRSEPSSPNQIPQTEGCVLPFKDLSIRDSLGTSKSIGVPCPHPIYIHPAFCLSVSYRGNHDCSGWLGIIDPSSVRDRNSLHDSRRHV